MAPPAWADATWDLERPIITTGVGPTLDLKVEPLAAKVIGAISARAADLVRIAAYVYAADQMLGRGGPVDVHRDDWRRQLALCVPVSDPAFWADPVQDAALRETLGFLTDDEWTFSFDESDPTVGQLPLDLPPLPVVQSPDAVVLFSGGTDSLCAVVQHVVDGGQPLVVSHRSAPQLDRWQRDLLAKLRGTFPSWSFPQLSFWVQRRHGDAANRAQRSRAFLFAALGAAVAGQIGIPTVLLPDNGYVSLNPPISAQLVGALASRSTHPTFLRLFNRIIEHAFPKPVRVINPLSNQTRAEALSILQPNGCADLLASTHSCGNHRGRSNAVPHCGGCSQCIDRRFSVIAAGLEAFDPAETYGLDVFCDALPEGEARTIAESYVRFARTVARTGDEELFLAFPQLVGALDPDDPRFGETGLGLIELLRRHADEVMSVLATRIGRYSARLAHGEFAPGSLLPLVVGTDVDRSKVNAGPAEVPARALENDAAQTRVHENVFVRANGMWHVAFRGCKGTYPRAKGMERLARLLAAPGAGISSLDLKVGPLGKAPDAADASVSEDEGFHLTGRGALGEVMDEAYVHSLEARAKELGDDIAQARQDGRDEDVDTLLSELEWITEHLQRSKGLHGQTRQFDDEHEAARKAVQKSVASTIASFAMDLPVLHDHLTRWVSLGLICRYDPVPKERWRVAL